MKIPTQIKIGGHIFKVQEVDTREMNDTGEVNTWRQIIRINNEYTPEDKRSEGLLHEILEVIKCYHNMSVDHSSLSTISELLFAVMRDNKLDFSK